MLLFVTADFDVGVLGDVICTTVASDSGDGFVYDGIFAIGVVTDSLVVEDTGIIDDVTVRVFGSFIPTNMVAFDVGIDDAVIRVDTNAEDTGGVGMKSSVFLCWKNW